MTLIFGHRPRRKTKTSPLEDRLARDLTYAGLAPPIREFRFAPPRQWRFDFAWPGRGLAVEVEGGTFIQGRHSRGAEVTKDCDKYNEAALRGWIVLRVTTDMCRSGAALRIVTRALQTEVRYVPLPLFEAVR